MAAVSVEKSAVMGAITLCDRSIQEFEKTSGALAERYRSVGTTWKDVKYKQLGLVVSDCTKALKHPVTELEECKARLQELLKLIEAYENSNI